MEENNVVKIKSRKRGSRWTIGIIIGVVVMAYVAFSAYHLINKKTVNYYEVMEGGMAKDTQHTGVIYRQEKVCGAEQSGYVNLLVKSGSRVKVGSDVYSVAASAGTVSTRPESETYSEEGAKQIKKTLSAFSANFDDDDFSSVYDAKTDVNIAALDAGKGSAESGDGYSGSGSKFYSPYSGIISFDIDGYEDRTADAVTETDFDKNAYNVKRIKSGEQVESGEALYKIVTDEEWYIVFRLTEEERKTYAECNNLNIIFKNNGLEYAAVYTQINASDGNVYGKLTLDKYMVDFINDRFVTFEIEEDSRNGLKIPQSAVVKKTFLLVPVDYLARGGDDLDEGFYKEVTTEKGTSIEYIPTEIFYETEEYYYINFSSKEDFQPGDVVVKPGTSDRYKLGETASLDGVYCINKGYTVFKQIDVIDTNEEYYTVRKGTRYGLAVYDHILFDPTGFDEGDFIYE